MDSEQTDYPAITELLPQRGRAVLIDRVLSHDRTTTVCAADPAASVLYLDADGKIPAWVGLEYMAQTVAAHGGLLHRAQSAEAAPKPGLFLGSRRIVFSADRFEPGCEIEISATQVRAGAGALAFDCSIRSAASRQLMVSGVLTVYVVDSFETLVEDFSRGE